MPTILSADHARELFGVEKRKPLGTIVLDRLIERAEAREAAALAPWLEVCKTLPDDVFADHRMTKEQEAVRAAYFAAKDQADQLRAEKARRARAWAAFENVDRDEDQGWDR